MSKKSLNIVYSNSAPIFSKIKEINSRLKNQKSDPIGTPQDIEEIQRGKSYAIFPELRKEDAKVDIGSIRESLKNRGVIDKEFQDKLLLLLLQHRGGIQFKLGKLVNDVLMEEKEVMLSLGDYHLDLEVNSPTDVTLTINTVLQEKDSWDSEKVIPALKTSVKVNITQDMVSITDFGVEKLSETQTASEAFKFLEDNQQNILQKFISFIKHSLGYDSELRLEDAKNDSTIGIGQP